MNNRASLYRLLPIALLAWGGLLAFTRFVPPSTPVAFIAFFVILSVALTSTCALLIYLISSRLFASQRYYPTIHQAMRQGALLSLVIVLNLIMRALHSWSLFMALTILGAAVVVEILSLAKK